MTETNLHAPYPGTYAALGGVPTIGVDVPICTVFLVLFMIGAASHMTIFQLNKKKGHKFIMSGMMFGFCMSRIVTTSVRIAWAVHPHNVRIAIAANIFVAAGVVLLFVINLLFSQRIVRACHPNAGWHPIVHYAFPSTCVLIVLSLLALITSVIQNSYTLDPNTKRIDRDIQLYGGTLYAVISFLPVPIVVGGLVVPRKTRVEKFGSGRFRHKIAVLILAAVLLCAGATFRAAVNYAGGKRPRNDPASYQNKACFYIFNFTVEIIVIYLYVAVRVDNRFFIPNGSRGPGDYSRKSPLKAKSMEHMRIAPEEEIFDDVSLEDLARFDSERQRVNAPDEEQGMPNDDENRPRQRPISALDGPAPWTSSPVPITQPPASHQRHSKVIEMSRD